MIEAWLAQTVPVRLIIVDNGSTPETLSELRSVIPTAAPIEVVETGANLGFGPGANVGLRRWLDGRPTDDWAFVAPHDALVAPDCIERLIAAAAGEPLAGMLCADVGDGVVPMIDPYFGGLTRPARRRSGWEDADYAHGTLLGISRRCALDVGLFDERYFAYNEEAELGLRARRRGWKIGLVHGARVTNTHVSNSEAVVDYLQHRNTLLMVKEMSGRYHAMIRLFIALGHIVTGWRSPERRSYVFVPRARLRGIADFLRGRTGPPPQDLFQRG
jgi:GT2 family glycosyltransferase